MYDSALLRHHFSLQSPLSNSVFTATAREHVLEEYLPVKCSELFHLVRPLPPQEFKYM